MYSEEIMALVSILVVIVTGLICIGCSYYTYCKKNEEKQTNEQLINKEDEIV